MCRFALPINVEAALMRGMDHREQSMVPKAATRE